MTVDTTVNRGILYATTILQQFVQDHRVSQNLRRHEQRLRRRVELTPVRPIELESVELNRLMGYYEDLFRLTKLVIRSVYIDDLRSASRESYALLVNMNTVFEKVVERAVEEIATARGWTSTGQARSGRLFTGDTQPVSVRPDVLVSDEAGADRLAGDAKWKRNDPEENSPEPSPSDIYQLVSYQVAHETPGVLFYPEQEYSLANEYEVRGLDSLTLVEVPVMSPEGVSLPNSIQKSVTEQLSLGSVER